MIKNKKNYLRILTSLLALFVSGASCNHPPLLKEETSKILTICSKFHDKYGDIISYITKFPHDQYKLVSVKDIGHFYIDDVNDAIKNSLRKGDIWESDNVGILRQYIKPGTTALDVGSHIGTLTIPMAQQVGPSGTVYAFEPQHKIYRELVMNLAVNKFDNVFAFRQAIGHEAGEIEMSALAHENEGGTGFGRGGSKAELITIDSLELDNISFIKIDVEGNEDNALRGARETILRNKPVMLIEIMGGHGYETAEPAIRAKIDATKHMISELGYEITRVSFHDYLAIPR